MRKAAGMAVGAAIFVTLSSSAAVASGPFIGPFTTISTVASTIPANGDLNPYGVAVVPRTRDMLTKGSVLVSNFNDSSNLQGTGTTLVEVSPNGTQTLFATVSARRLHGGHCPGGIGLTTALTVLGSGWVIVGSLPTTDGTAGTAGAGCLIVLNSKGHVVEMISGPRLNGPWDMTAVDRGDRAVLFVTNVLNGTVAANGKVVDQGTVMRIVLDIHTDRAPTVVSRTIVASGFRERTDPSALVIGPTGLALANGKLFVADTLRNRIAVISNALSRGTSGKTGRTLTSKGSLDSPLGMAIAPNGDLLTVNGGDGNIVETTRAGKQVATKTLDSTGTPPGAGTLFGLAVALGHDGVYFVDDGANTLNLLD